MSRIDDALRRLTQKSADPATPPGVRFASEGEAGRREARDAVQPPDRRFAPRPPAAARPASYVPPVRETAAPHRTRWAKLPVDAGDLNPTDKVLDVRQIIHYVGFACRAVRRRKGLVILAFMLAFGMTVAATFLVPKSYDVEVKLLAQRSAIIASLSNPGRTIPYDADAPTRAAAETILRRDNVIALIRQTDLINEWDRTRAPILRVYDRWKAKLLRREPTLDDKLDEIVTQVEKRMVVSAPSSHDGLVTISLAWPDAHSGYLLVERAQEAFLEARQVAETQAIAEAITILERYAESLNKDIQVTLAEFSRTQARVLRELPETAAPPRPPSLVARALDTPDPLELVPGWDDPLVDPATLADPRLGRLKSAAAMKRADLTRLENEHKRKLSELQAQLSVARKIYTPNHPTVQSLQQSVSASEHNSPQIAMLRNELDRLEMESDDQAAAAAERLIRAELSRRSGTPPPPAPRLAPAAAPAPAPPAIPGTPGAPRANAVAEFATLRLRTELSQLQSVLERTDAARIEFAASQAAFKHRYSIISPAAEPGEPSFPDTRRVLGAGFLASLLFALAAAVAADIMSSRILEPWQVQRQLGLPLIGIVRAS